MHLLPYMFFRILVFLIALTIVSCGKQEISKSHEPTPKVELVSTIDTKLLEAYLASIYENNKWIGSVAISKNGNLEFVRAYGKVHPDHDEPAAINTKYKIGSITKTYVAAIIMQMVEEGKLNLDTKLSDYFPKIKNANKITVEHLLRHRSGIYNYTDHESFDPTREISPTEMIKMLENFSSDFEPGSKYAYSNSGYFLLGLIMEAVDKSNFQKILQKRILSKLDATSVGLFDVAERDENEVVSAIYMEKDWVPIPEWHYSQANTAGGLQTTAIDQIKFVEALFNGKLISEVLLAKMMDIKDGYGLGLMQVPFNEKKGYGHNGGLEAFRSALYHFPDDDVTLSLLSNGLSIDNNDVLIALSLAAFGLPIEIPEFKEVAFEEGEFDMYTGDFSCDALPMDIKIFVKEGALFAQATGQGAFPLSKEKTGVLTFDGAGIKMEFAKNSDGRYGSFTLLQGGGNFLFKRKKIK